MVTGAGGSIGSELCRQICRFEPRILILYERAESALFERDIELRASFPAVNVIPVLGDIRDRSQIAKALGMHRPELVFHAAAYKHLPMMELHSCKAVRNNFLGALRVPFPMWTQTAPRSPIGITTPPSKTSAGRSCWKESRWSIPARSSSTCIWTAF